MIVKIEMAVEAIQDAHRRMRAKKFAKQFAAEIQAASDAFESFFEHTIRPIAEQIEQKRKAEENNETGEDGQGR